MTPNYIIFWAGESEGFKRIHVGDPKLPAMSLKGPSTIILFVVRGYEIPDMKCSGEGFNPSKKDSKGGNFLWAKCISMEELFTILFFSTLKWGMVWWKQGARGLLIR